MGIEKNPKLLHFNLKGALKGLRLKKVIVNQGTFRLKKYRDEHPITSVAGLNLQANDIWFDSLSYLDPKRIYYAKEASITATRTNHYLPDGNYKLQTGNINLQTKSGIATIKKAQLIPLRSASQLARQQGRATPLLQLSVPEIQLKKVNYASYSRTKAIDIGSVTFNRPHLYAYMDGKNFPAKGKKALLHDLVQSFKGGLLVRHASIKGMRIRYEELAPRAVEKGFLTLTNMNLSLTNISNLKSRMSDQTPAIIKGSMLIMGKAWFTATVRANLLNTNGYHTIRGTLGKANPQVINPLIEPAYYIRVRSGLIQKGTFFMALDNKRATGTMRLEYDNFKVDLLSKADKPKKTNSDKEGEPKKKKQSLGKKLLSVFANKVILNTHNNPQKNGPLGIAGFKTGEINTTRRENRSLFTYWIDGLASGMRSTLGLKSQIPNK